MSDTTTPDVQENAHGPMDLLFYLCAGITCFFLIFAGFTKSPLAWSISFPLIAITNAIGFYKRPARTRSVVTTVMSGSIMTVASIFMEVPILITIVTGLIYLIPVLHTVVQRVRTARSSS